MVANTSPTATSSGSDLKNMAIQHTCRKSNARLALYDQEYDPDARLKTLAHAAYHDHVNLTPNSFYKTPKTSTNGAIIWTPYQYTATSPGRRYPECRARRTHRLSLHPPRRHKNGRRPLLNPAIDYGQIEGAFVQGQGLFTIHHGGNIVAAEWPTLHSWARNLRDPWICGHPAGIQPRSTQGYEVS